MTAKKRTVPTPPATPPALPPLATSPSLVSEFLDSGAAAARAVAATVSNWTHPAGEKYRALFTAAEKKYSIPNNLLFRQAYQESRFRADIIDGRKRSAAGAVGIMQIIPKWHPELSPGDAAADERAALDPAKAIDYAGKYLRQLYNRFGKWTLALAAYNAGPGNVSKYGGVPPFKETHDYVAQISADVRSIQNA